MASLVRIFYSGMEKINCLIEYPEDMVDKQKFETFAEARSYGLKRLKELRGKSFDIIDIRNNHWVSSVYSGGVKKHTLKISFRGFRWFYNADGVLEKTEDIPWVLIEKGVKDKFDTKFYEQAEEILFELVETEVNLERFKGPRKYNGKNIGWWLWKMEYIKGCGFCCTFCTGRLVPASLCLRWLNYVKQLISNYGT